MSPSRYVMALDGGGTKTVAAVADLSGRVLGIGTAAASNPLFVSPQAAEEAVAGAVADALSGAGLPGAEVSVLGGCLSNPLDLPRILQGVLGDCRIRVLPEADVCLASAYEVDEGAVVLAGTGSFEWARGPNGTSRRDGWGTLLGDEGSAYWLARAGFMAAGRGLDGRGPATALTAELGEAARRLYREGRSMERREVAAHAPAVTRLAQEGDPVAAAICRLGAGRLARGLRLCMADAGLLDRPCTVVLSGSVLRHGAAVRERLRHLVARFAPQARVQVPYLDPLRGGLFLALREAGVAPTVAVRAHLESSMQLTGERGRFA